MTRHATWIAALFAVLSVASGCQTTAPASECDGWQKLSPSADTHRFIITNDRPFAEGRRVSQYVRHPSRLLVTDRGWAIAGIKQRGTRTWDRPR